jgi:hypothetical protein
MSRSESEESNGPETGEVSRVEALPTGNDGASNWGKDIVSLRQIDGRKKIAIANDLYLAQEFEGIRPLLPVVDGALYTYEFAPRHDAWNRTSSTVNCSLFRLNPTTPIVRPKLVFTLR